MYLHVRVYVECDHIFQHALDLRHQSTRFPKLRNVFRITGVRDGNFQLPAKLSCGFVREFDMFLTRWGSHDRCGDRDRWSNLLVGRRRIIREDLFSRGWRRHVWRPPFILRDHCYGLVTWSRTGCLNERVLPGEPEISSFFIRVKFSCSSPPAVDVHHMSIFKRHH